MTMRVTMLKEAFGPDRALYAVGSIQTVEDDVGASWVAIGTAVDTDGVLSPPQDSWDSATTTSAVALLSEREMTFDSGEIPDPRIAASVSLYPVTNGVTGDFFVPAGRTLIASASANASTSAVSGQALGQTETLFAASAVGLRLREILPTVSRITAEANASAAAIVIEGV
jgi:hypothetical protein